MEKKKRGRPRKVEEKDYSITLQMGDLLTQGTGSSMFEALQSLPKPAKIVMKGVVVVSNGEKERSYVYMPLKIKRMFFPIAQKVVAKQFEYGL